MPATIDEHVALLHAFASEDIFATWVAIDASEPWWAYDGALAAVSLLPVGVAETLSGKAVTSPMPATIDEHVALVRALACENIFAARFTIYSCEAGRTNKWTLTAISVAPARMARAFARQAVTPPMTTTIDEHVAFLHAFLHENVFAARLTIRAREPGGTDVQQMTMRCRYCLILFEPRKCCVDALALSF
jgi:hypothetical protein